MSLSRGRCGTHELHCRVRSAYGTVVSDRYTDDTTWHCTLMLFHGTHECSVWTAVTHRNTETVGCAEPITTSAPISPAGLSRAEASRSVAQAANQCLLAWAFAMMSVRSRTSPVVLGHWEEAHQIRLALEVSRHQPLLQSRCTQHGLTTSSVWWTSSATKNTLLHFCQHTYTV